MSQPAELLQFLTIAKSSEIWRSVSSAIMTVTNEAQFEAGPNGIEFRSKDQAREAFIDIFIPGVVFQRFHCPVLLKFGIRINEFSKIIKRINGNFPVEVCIQDRFLVVTTIGTFFCCYKSNLIESRPSVSALEEIAFDTKLVIGTEALASILDDVGVFSEMLTLKTIRRPEIATTFSGVSDRGAALWSPLVGIMGLQTSISIHRWQRAARELIRYALSRIYLTRLVPQAIVSN